jgi:transcription initiation factor TFIIB
MSDLWPTLRPTKVKHIEVDDSFLDAATEDSTAEKSYTCPTCEDTSAVQHDGAEVVCTRCGSIVDIPLEWAAEYRWFSSDSGGGGPDPSRCGFPVNHLMPESSLGTMILNNRQSPLMRRIKRYHMWNLMPYRERTLWTVFEGLQVRAANAGISNAVLDEAKELYAQLTASAICRGQAQRDAMLAACIWEALKRHEAPRMPKDIADIFIIPLRQVTKGIKQFQELLAKRTTEGLTDTYANPGSVAAPPSNTMVIAHSDTAVATTARAHHRRAIWQKTVGRTTSYEDFIVPFITNLSIKQSGSLEAMVRHICARTEELGVVPENTPPSLTASVIAFSCAELGISVELGEVARVCGISAVTIQKCLKRMTPWRGPLLENFPTEK